MFERNLLANEIQSLQTGGAAEFEMKKNAVVGRVAWAKTLLNKLLGTSLPDDDQADENFRKAIARFQSANNLKETSKLDFQTERLLLEQNALVNLTDSDAAKRAIIVQAKTKIEDWMDKAIIREKKKHLILQQFRDPRIITALVLHHMAYKAKDGRGNLSNPQTYLAVGAHFCIMLDGRIMQHHPVSRFIWHSNCTSPRSVGVEFEGNFPDIKGRWWYPTDKETGKKIKINEDLPTQAQFESGRFLLSYLKLVLGLKIVLAHRQSSEDRENDPGPAIWFNVGEWGLANLGIGDGGKDFKCGTGNPILDAWRNWKQTGQPLPSSSPPRPPSLPKSSGGNTPIPVRKDDLSKAVATNRLYGEKLGWYSHIERINDFLLPFSGQSNVSLGEEAFANALKNWQSKNGFDADGVMGPKTWSAVKQILDGKGNKLPSSPNRSPAKPKNSPEQQIIDGVRFVKKGIGWAAYGGGDLRKKLYDLKQKGLLEIRPNEIETFAIVSIPESGGAINAINSWDSAYMSMGFFQFPVKFGKLQRVIAKVPAAFKKHGIELDAPRKYILKDEQPTAIKNAAAIADLRSLEWAVKFYRAGLEDDAIIAQISVAREILGKLLKNYDPKKYLEKFKDSHPNLWAFIFEAHNSRPAILQTALQNAIKKAVAGNVDDPFNFARILIEELKTATQNYYSRVLYDKNFFLNETKKSARIKDELAKVGRIIEKTKIRAN